MRSAQKLEKDLEEVSDRNERLTALLKNTEAYLGESETREKDYLSTFKKLRALLNVTEEDFSLDTLISVVESRVEEWQSYGNHDGSIALLADEVIYPGKFLLNPILLDVNICTCISLLLFNFAEPRFAIETFTG